ncbi:unnamed protein product, partial [Prorocentrum cordatum]
MGAVGFRAAAVLPAEAPWQQQPWPGGGGDPPAPAEPSAPAPAASPRLLAAPLATVALYFGFAVAFFWWQEGWSAVDCFYFTAAVLTTVGY